METSLKKSGSYQYRPFAPVRLLKVERLADGRISGFLQNYDLNSDSCPGFVAVSYVWGPPDYSHCIYFDDVPFPVRDNVFALLEALCDGSSHSSDDDEEPWKGVNAANSLVWIDSICINQADAIERAQQVQQMDRIYRDSAQTIAWLGPGNQWTDRALRFLRRMARDVVVGRFNEADYWEDEASNVPEAATDPEAWRSLQWLLDEDKVPYWKRAWTLQEFVLPRRLTLWCGNERIGCREFEAALKGVHLCRHYCSRLGVQQYWGTPWARRRVRQLAAIPDLLFDKKKRLAALETDQVDTEGLEKRLLEESIRGLENERISLVALLAFTGNYDCTDPRDRVYSLLGMVGDTDRQIVGTPSYGEKDSVEDLYRRVVLNFICMRQSLDIICFGPLFRGQNSGSGDGEAYWPSWLPDWRAKVKPVMVPLMVSQPHRNHIGCLKPSLFREIEGVMIGTLRVPIDPNNKPVYSASGDSWPSWRFDSTSQALVCRGRSLDAVNGVAATVSDEVEGEGEEEFVITPMDQSISPSSTSFSYDSGAAETTNYATADALISTLVLGRGDRNLELAAPIPLFRAQLQELLGRCGAGGEGPRYCGTDEADTKVNNRGRKLLLRWKKANSSFLLAGGRTLADVLTDLSTPPSDAELRALPVCWEGKEMATRLLETLGTGSYGQRMTMFKTDGGGLGMGPAHMRKGDVVCVLHGCSVPVVLRKAVGDDTYVLVGECYLHGFMNGEALALDVPQREFWLL